MALVARGATFSQTRSNTNVFAKQTAISHQNIGGKRDFPGNLKETRLRMRSVKQIQKITQTMKLIASSRLRSAERKVKETYGFYQSASKILSLPAEKTASGEEKRVEKYDIKKAIVVPICTDRGLCGGVNSQLMKRAKLLVAEKAAEGVECRYITIGDKATPILARDSGDKVIVSFGDVAKKPLTFAGVSVICDKIFEQDPDQVIVLYNQFNNIISNTLTIKDVPSHKFLYADKRYLEYETEDDQRQFELQDLYEFEVGATVMNAFVSNQASELGSRMSSMESASKNASDMLKRLTLKYNRGRQANITTELIEIISGAAALEG
jgi:F-type H+-transporting ATPase subunit gamma